jgi:hypothetical protein
VFRLALFAMARLMGKTLFPEEELFSGAEDKFLAAIDALENTVGEFHRSTSPELPDLQLLDLNAGTNSGFGQTRSSCHHLFRQPRDCIAAFPSPLPRSARIWSHVAWRSPCTYPGLGVIRNKK